MNLYNFTYFLKLCSVFTICFIIAGAISVDAQEESFVELEYGRPAMELIGEADENDNKEKTLLSILKNESEKNVDYLAIGYRKPFGLEILKIFKITLARQNFKLSNINRNYDLAEEPTPKNSFDDRYLKEIEYERYSTIYSLIGNWTYFSIEVGMGTSKIREINPQTEDAKIDWGAYPRPFQSDSDSALDDNLKFLQELLTNTNFIHFSARAFYPISDFATVGIKLIIQQPIFQVSAYDISLRGVTCSITKPF